VEKLLSKDTGELLIYLGFGTLVISGTVFLVMLNFYEHFWFLVLMTLVTPPLILVTGILLKLFGFNSESIDQ